MAKIRVYKRNATFVELSDLVGAIGLRLNKYDSLTFEHEAESIVAG